MTVAQFANVASLNGEISLTSLVPTAAAGVDTAYNVVIQLLDSAGYTTDAEYTWNGNAWDGNDVENVTFAAGQGLWVYSYCGEDVVGFQSAGKVTTSDVAFVLDKEYGAVGVGNAFPTPIKLTDMLVTAAEGVDTAYNVVIQILDSAGYTTDAEYTWNGSSWDGTDVENVTFAPGQGLWVYSYCGEDEVTLRLPAPEL
jgi:hypothetical protein